MTLFKGFNKSIFWASMVIIIILFVPIFFATWANDEGTLPSTSEWFFLTKFHFLFTFPIQDIFRPLMADAGGFVFFAVTFINLMFYGFIMERCIYFVGRLNKPKVAK